MTDARNAFRFATVTSHGIHWLLNRNCSLSPRQMGLFYGLLCVISLGVALMFWWLGAVLVLPFAALELVVVGLAFLFYARHATDGERISLLDDRLIVELESAGRMERAEFSRGWVRVEPCRGDGSLIELFGDGRKVRVGRYVRADQRPALAREIRLALRAA